MEELTPETAEKFARENFGKMPEAEKGWNMLHSFYFIKALEEVLSNQENNKNVNIERLKALAWVHDLGKIKSEENHAELGVDILKEVFELDELDKECISNHGSSGKPKSEEAKIFQSADGLSLFYPELIAYRFWMKSKEGESFDKVKEKLKKHYERYLEAYAGREKVINLLKEKFNAFINSASQEQ